MVRKHTLPGVDEAALSELARQFPAHDVEPPPPLSHDTPASSGQGTPRRSGAGSGIAIAVSIVALIVASVPVAAPYFGSEITRVLGETSIRDAVLGGRPQIERRLADEAAQRAAFERKSAEQLEQLNAALGKAEIRLGTIEAVGGGGFDAAARRVEAAEAALGAAMTRVGTVEGELSQTRTAFEALGRDVGALDARVAGVGPALQEKLAEIEPRLAAIEQRAVAAIDAKAAALEQNVAAASDRAARAEAAASQAAAKSSQVEQDFAQLRQFNRSSVRLFLIALHLRTAIQTPAPFVREVQALRGLIGDNAEAAAALGTLTQHANGIRTLSDLRDAFVASAGAQVKALAAGLDASWASRLAAFVSGPQMPQTGEGEQVWRVVMQAEQALNQGNLAAAINHVERFDGPAGSLVADWLRDAKARLAVENAAAGLSVYALNQLVGS